MASKTRVPAVEGWFTMDDAPALIGSRCGACGTVSFPKQAGFCRNPACTGDDLADATLSRRGRVWSFTTNHYRAPEPFVAPEPFEPYTVAAVELADEQMVVLGRVAPDVDPASLSVGAEVELGLGTLYADDEHEYVVWEWRPAAGA